ncbi:hypothetical protein, partial [Bradyrhizobium sp.]|uniref:hypothetical protein n=1 Tax=Bradyrhizobium sp. TaxID=376 RepID=UPI00290310A7
MSSFHAPFSAALFQFPRLRQVVRKIDYHLNETDLASIGPDQHNMSHVIIHSPSWERHRTSLAL